MSNLGAEVVYGRAKRIYRLMEAGQSPWQIPKRIFTAQALPFNFCGANEYQGGNIVRLLEAQRQFGFKEPAYATAAQITRMGGSLKAKGVPFTIRSFVDPEELGSGKAGEFGELFEVFNLDHVKGLRRPIRLPVRPTKADAIKLALAFVKATRAKVQPSEEEQPQYWPDFDVIEMPEPSFFESKEEYAATLLHELIHWTGHKSRCNRDFETKPYEELVAELGASFLCAKFGVCYRLRFHADYLKYWLSMFKGSPMIYSAAVDDAYKAVKYLDRRVNKPGKAKRLAH